MLARPLSQPEFLPDFVKCREFLNADLIAAGLSPFAPETQNMRAGRLLLERIRELSKSTKDFGFETTLAGRMHVKLLADLKTLGLPHRSVFPLAAQPPMWRSVALPGECSRVDTPCPKRS